MLKFKIRGVLLVDRPWSHENMDFMKTSKILNKNILITGGAGFIGSHLVDEIITHNPNELLVVDNFFLGQDKNLIQARNEKPNLHLLRLDASDISSMRHVAKKYNIDYVFDLAIVPLPLSLEYPEWTIRTNVGIVTTFCELLRHEEVDEMLHFSSSEAYGTARYIPMDELHPHDAITPYAASKSAADCIINSYIQTFGIEARIVRPFNNFGPRQNPGSYAGVIPIVVKKILAGEPIEIYGDGQQTRDFIFVSETVKAVTDIFNSSKSARISLNLGTGIETTINELVSRILRISGNPDHQVVYKQPRAGDVRRHCADMSRTSEILGYTPTSIMDDQLSATIEWYMKTLR